MAAFQLAVDQGANGVELDVQRSLDGVLVVCHDETVNRTTSGSGEIRELTSEQLTGLGLPTLADVLDLLAGTSMTINLELKDSVVPYLGMAQQVVGIVTGFGLAERVIVSSFNHLSIAGLAKSQVPMRLGLLYPEPLFEPWDYATRIGAQAVHPSGTALNIDPGSVALCHERGIAVHVWTLDEPAHLLAAAHLGVDAVITNRPAMALQVISGAAASPPGTGQSTNPYSRSPASPRPGTM